MKHRQAGGEDTEAHSEEHEVHSPKNHKLQKLRAEGEADAAFALPLLRGRLIKHRLQDVDGDGQASKSRTESAYL